MKNIFKFLGIAVLACGMMVACTKDDPETNPTNDNGGNGGNDNPPATTSSAKVTLGSISWDVALATAYTNNYESYGLVEYMLCKTTAQEYPFVDMMIAANPGTYSAQAELGQADGYTYYGWQSMDIYDINYFEATIFQQQTQSGGTIYRGDWRPVTASLSVSAFDLNTLAATYELNATMYDFASWYQDLVTNAEDAETKDMNIKVNNYTFTQAQ